MAEEKAKKGSKTKLKPWMYVAIIGGAGLVYYLYKQHAANTASTSSSAPASSIDPLTGQPYTAGVGSLAGGGTGGTTQSTDPFQAIDPNTGQTYASELSGLASSQAQTQSALGSLVNQITTLGNGSTTSPSTGSGGHNAALNAWRAEKARVIAKAEGISVAQAGQAISQYLQGKPITNAAAARGISNVVKNSGQPPTATGHPLPIRVAKSRNAAATKHNQPKPKTPVSSAAPPRTTTNRSTWHPPEVLPRG